MSKRATLRQIAAIVTTLEEVIVQFSPGKCHYKEGHSDSSIAKPHGLHPAHVGRIRRDMFGELVKPPKPKPTNFLAELEA